jgi:hypothetical protein
MKKQSGKTTKQRSQTKTEQISSVSKVNGSRDVLINVRNFPILWDLMKSLDRIIDSIDLNYEENRRIFIRHFNAMCVVIEHIDDPVETHEWPVLMRSDALGLDEKELDISRYCQLLRLFNYEKTDIIEELLRENKSLKEIPSEPRYRLNI